MCNRQTSITWRPASLSWFSAVREESGHRLAADRGLGTTAQPLALLVDERDNCSGRFSGSLRGANGAGLNHCGLSANGYEGRIYEPVCSVVRAMPRLIPALRASSSRA